MPATKRSSAAAAASTAPVTTTPTTSTSALASTAIPSLNPTSTSPTVRASGRGLSNHSPEAIAAEEFFEEASLAVIKPDVTTQRAAHDVVPQVLRFPLLVLGTLLLSAAGYSVLAEVGEFGNRVGGVGTGVDGPGRGGYGNGIKSGRGELSAVSRTLRGWWEVGAVIGWRTFELALGWYGDLDGYDITALGLLSRGPTLYLLSAFYDISTPTILSSLLIDFASTYIPFRLLRPLAPTHSGSSRLRIPNKEIANDYSVQFLSTILASAIYSVTIFTAYKTVLPRTLALDFDGIKSLEDVYRLHWLPLLPLMAGFGAAVKEFVFTPALVVLPTPQDVLNAKFDPLSATLLETIRYNFWGFSTRTKTILKRTAILMAVSGAHTFVQTWFTLEGVAIRGASVYAGVWVVAAALAGGALGLVGAV